jgi:hypothetical protein
MRDDATKAEDPGPKLDSASPRKPYGKPQFRFERVFETMALACGKVSPTQKHCRFVRKSS